MQEAVFPWVPFILFAMVNSITPGPNVILLASSGGAWGLKKTLPHLLGVCLGFPLMLLLVLYGSDQVFKRLPWVFSVLTVTSLLYILWLAYRVLKMGFDSELKLKTRTRPMGFTEAILFQWINGKAWQVTIMVSTLYLTTSHVTRILEVLVMVVISFAAGIFWIELGKRIARFLNKPTVRKVYYSVLAIALILSTWPTGIIRLLSETH
jgi:threonine/homoserine/homoserine lactone efflux protein